MNVRATPEVKQYFGFEDSAKAYVKELVNDIFENLPQKQHRPAPSYFDKYGKGMYYTAFTKNKHTTWYAFFTKYEEGEEQSF